MAAKEEKRSLSKLIKADESPVIEVRKIVPHTGDEEETFPDNTLFCPFSVVEEVCDREGGEESKGEKTEKLGEEKEEVFHDPIRDSRREADKILEEAKKEARRLREEAESFLESARRKAEEIESQAYNNGFEQGKKDGEELGKRQFEAMCNRLRSLIESLNGQGKELFSKYEEQMVRLCLKIAKKIVAVELDTRPELVLEALRLAVDEIEEATEIKIFLHPKDLEVVKESVVSRTDLTSGHKMEFLPNETIGRGGCIIETEFALVDASFETRWKAIEEAVSNALRKGVAQ